MSREICIVLMTVCLRIRFRPDFFPPQDAGDEAAAEIRVDVFQYSRRALPLPRVLVVVVPARSGAGTPWKVRTGK